MNCLKDKDKVVVITKKEYPWIWNFMDVFEYSHSVYVITKKFGISYGRTGTSFAAHSLACTRKKMPCLLMSRNLDVLTVDRVPITLTDRKIMTWFCHERFERNQPLR